MEKCFKLMSFMNIKNNEIYFQYKYIPFLISKTFYQLKLNAFVFIYVLINLNKLKKISFKILSKCQGINVIFALFEFVCLIGIRWV